MRLRSERLTWREMDGEIVALDLETQTYLTANSTASMLFELMAEGPVTAEDLVSQLLAEFDVEAATATAAVQDFLADLEARGLLEA